MNQNPLARLFGLTNKEFSVSLAVGGVIVLAALVFEGYTLFKTGQAPPTGPLSPTLAAPSTQAFPTPTEAPPLSTAAPLARSLPTLVMSSGRPVIAGGVIAGPATEGAFLQGAATARPITAPPGLAGGLASGLNATATAKSPPSQAGTAIVSPGMLTPSPATQSNPLASVLDPVPVGTAFTLPDFGVLTVKSTSWQPGLTGLAIANVSFTCQRAAPERCDTSTLILAAVGSSGNSYERAYDSTIPDPTFGSFALPHLLNGQTDQGNAGFLVTNAESALTLRVRVFLQEGEYYFWLGKKP